MPSTDTCRSSIASSRAAWVFGGVRLISSASSRLVKTGPGAELEARGARVVHQRTGHVTGHQVRGELHAFGLEGQGGGHGTDQQRLRHTGHALEEYVSPTQQRDDDAGHGGVLPDNRFGHLGSQGDERLACSCCAGARRAAVLTGSRAADLPVEVVEVGGELDERGLGVGSRTVQQRAHPGSAASGVCGDGGRHCSGLGL